MTDSPKAAGSRKPREGHSLTMANEDYLEAIYRIHEKQPSADGVRSVDVAELLGVSKASVNKALATLKEAGLVEQQHYGKVTLTEEGAAYAADVWCCHRMLRAFLRDELKVDPDVADDEACQMEHALSHDTMLRWIDYLTKQGVRIED
jgi:DtxR family Mn-dependent transcriptional regulator